MAQSARVFTSLLYKCLLTHTAHARSWCSSPVKGTLGRSVFKYLLTAFSGIFLLHLLVWIWSFTHFLAFFHTVQFINWRRHSRNCVWQLQLQKSGWTLNNNLKKLVNLRPLWKTPLTVWFVSPCIMSLPSPLSQLPLPPGVNTNVLWYPSKHSRFDHLSSSSAAHYTFIINLPSLLWVFHPTGLSWWNEVTSSLKEPPCAPRPPAFYESSMAIDKQIVIKSAKHSTTAVWQRNI